MREDHFTILQSNTETIKETWFQLEKLLGTTSSTHETMSKIKYYCDIEHTFLHNLSPIK